MSMLLLSLGCSSVYTRYTRPLWGPPVRSQASPGSASTERSGCAGMKSNPPTCVSVTNTPRAETSRPQPVGVHIHEELAAALPALGERADLHEITPRADCHVPVRAVVSDRDDIE